MRIDDGHPTKITFSKDGSGSGITFWEKSVTPPGVDGGGENDTTTMHNVKYRTRSPKKLITMTAMSMVCAYDPVVYEDIMDSINVNQQITVEFPDGSTVTFWGWLNSFVPGDVAEGEQPTATVEIIPSNQNDDGAEMGPTYAEA